MKQYGKIPAMQVPMLNFGFLSDINQEAYQEALSQYEGKARNSLDVLRNGRGSNTFTKPFLTRYPGILPEGERVLTLAEFGEAQDHETARILAMPGYFSKNLTQHAFHGTYQDSAAIVRTEFDQGNEYFARNLFRKLAKKDFHASPENPVVIDTANVGLRKDSRSEYGLVFDLRDNTVILQGKNVSQAYGSNAEIGRFTVYDAQGIPVPDKDGKFRIWNRNEGVSRVYSGRSQVAVAYFGLLADSSDDGRVVVGKLEKGAGE